jgi:hypothetical protein
VPFALMPGREWPRSVTYITVAGAERSSAVLKHDNRPNAELALCASRRATPVEGGKISGL